MTHEQEEELDKTLIATSVLLGSMIPRDRLLQAALIEEKRDEATRTIGQVYMALELVQSARNQLKGAAASNGSAPKKIGRPPGIRETKPRGGLRGHQPGELVALITKRLAQGPTRKNLLTRYCMEEGGFRDPSVYTALKRMTADGRIKVLANKELALA